jgi:nitroreductase
MDVLEAVLGRQSIGKVKPDPVPHVIIEQLLVAAAQAPNHYKVRPWRFVVLTGRAREKLGEVMAKALHQRFPGLNSEALAKEAAKALRAPVLIAVAVDAPSDPRVHEIENICAAAAACENLLLAAHSLQLGAHWRTGEAAREAGVKAFLGFSEGQHVIAFLYIGYPEVIPPPPERPGPEDRTVWMED